MNNEDTLFGGLDISPAVDRLKAKTPTAAPQRGGGKFKISPKESRTFDGRVYDSKLEMQMHQELLKHFPPEDIALQVKFILQPRYCLDGCREMQRALVYKADFVLGALLGPADDPRPAAGSMVLDAKGMVLSSFVVASKLFEYKHRLPVIAVKSVKQLKTYIEQYKMSTQVNQEHLKVIDQTVFRVMGYVNSDGQRSNLMVRVIGKDGYRDLVRQSKEIFDLARLERSAEEPTGDIFYEIAGPVGILGLLTIPEEELAAYNAAADKVRESLTKKLQEVEEESAVRRASNEVYQAISPNIGFTADDPQRLVVMRLEILHREVLEEPEGKTKKAAKTNWRAEIEKRLPISRYCHRLNLYPGKFDGLE